jgi:hypothetical protein
MTRINASAKHARRGNAADDSGREYACGQGLFHHVTPSRDIEQSKVRLNFEQHRFASRELFPGTVVTSLE